MKVRIGKLLVRLGIVLVLLALVGFLFLIYTVRRSFPQTTGELRITGLKQPVRIYRDKFGVPQIYASTKHDLFVAQGFLHAQERFWQMDVWRHIGSGTLSEMFGKTQLQADQFLRTMNWRKIAQQELREIDLDSLQILQDYTSGVNAHLRTHRGSALSLEYGVLRLMNPSYVPFNWQPADSLTWGKVMSYDLSLNMDLEIYRSKLRKTLSASDVNELYPPYPHDNPVIVSIKTPANVPQQIVSSLPDNLLDRMALLEPLLETRGARIGSNNWVISGKHTTTGKPYLCSDPHLATRMPSIWYQIGLHCSPKTDACPFDVTGFSFAGTPGVIIGHNDRIAWGFTNVGPDVMDLYIEKLNPNNPDQYEVNGRWVGMQVATEYLKIAGDQPAKLKVRSTRHGPIISETYSELEKFDQESGGLSLPQPFAVSLQWTAMQPSRTFPAIWKMSIARNWKEFRAAAEEFDVPSQNLIYADVDGNIGYQMSGRVPIRTSGDGRYPVPGWTDEYKWKAYIPFEELPSEYNPEKGYVATANNAVTDAAYPYLITHDWDYGFRARRIVEMIESANGKIDVAYLRKMQNDNKNFNAQFLVPLLLRLNFQDARSREAQKLLVNWDYQQNMDSTAAALFETFWTHLLVETLHDDFPEWYKPGGGDNWVEVFRNLVRNPNHHFWDNQKTNTKEDRDQILRQAFEKAVVELEKVLGKDPTQWKWGNLHTTMFRNGTLGRSGIWIIERLFNRGPYPTAGGTAVVNATGWDASDSFEVTNLPSMRMIVDLNDLDQSETIHTTGQSGHAYHPHYIDLADMWRKGEYYPMLFSRESVEAGPKELLTLVP